MLREFLYVDVTRVRSLLAQLDQAVLEKVVERRGESKDFQIGLRFLGSELNTIAKARICPRNLDQFRICCSRFLRRLSLPKESSAM
jgi:hypothetical protein